MLVINFAQRLQRNGKARKEYLYTLRALFFSLRPLCETFLLPHIKLYPLCQRHFRAEINCIRLTAHVDLPCITS